MIKLFQCERDFGVDQTEPYFIGINFQLGSGVFEREKKKQIVRHNNKPLFTVIVDDGSTGFPCWLKKPKEKKIGHF